MRNFTIIGGGASGTLLAVNLIKQNGDQPLVVNLVEKNGKFGNGVAYSTSDDLHLLNVPANKMGAFPDDVEHFHKWLGTNNYNYFSNDFVPRRIYGEYLRSLLYEAIDNSGDNVTVSLINDEVEDVSVTPGETKVTLSSGESFNTDKIILAFGNFLPPNPRLVSQDYVSAPKYFANPWSKNILNQLAPTDDILVIGLGLTAVDTLMSLHALKHDGHIFAISTHGWLPSVHELGFLYPSFANELEGKTSVLEMFKIIRKHVETAEKEKSNWRAVIDSLRPATQKLWVSLSLNEKRRFMRHLRRLWDVSRHRMPMECDAKLKEMQESGKLELLKGRVRQIEQTADGRLSVTYVLKEKPHTIEVDAIINCTGSESNFTRLDAPLVKNLLRKNYIQTDNLALGLEAAPNGKISNQIYTVGTALKGILWEATAMPEIRAQANQLAKDLLN